MYGFSYLDAGRNVLELFQNKGWTVIITDDLADNVLFMMSVGIGLASGLVGLVLATMTPTALTDLGFESSLGPGFLIGFLAGLVFSSVMLSVVGSAINTVIVCKFTCNYIFCLLNYQAMADNDNLFASLFHSRLRLCGGSRGIPSKSPPSVVKNARSLGTSMARHLNLGPCADSVYLYNKHHLFLTTSLPSPLLYEW
jgi:hypothetical protein